MANLPKVIFEPYYLSKDKITSKKLFLSLDK